jgi:large subunit ribosomal protein L24
MTTIKFSNAWKASKQRRKQRKYAFNAPLHTRGKFLSAHLASELATKHDSRSARVRVGDKVKVVRGQFAGTIGAVTDVNIKNAHVYVEKVELVKRDGSKVKYPIHASKVIILELVDDKRRFEAKTKPAKAPKADTVAKPAKAAPKKVA